MNELYELAFKYRETKLWEYVFESEFFAVKLSSGEIAYISIMGAFGTHNAIGIYIGDKGFYCLNQMFNYIEIMSDYDSFKIRNESENLQLIFGNKSDIKKCEADEVKRFKKENNIKVYGKNTFPYIRKSRLYSPLGTVNSEEDREFIKEVTRAVLDFAKILQHKSKQEIGLEKMYNDKEDIPLLEKIGEKYELNGKVKLPWNYKIEYPVANNIDKNLVSKLKKIRKSNNILQSEIFIIPNYMEDIEGFLQLLLVVDEDTELIIQSSTTENYTKDPDDFVNKILKSLIESKINPIEIKCADERTYSLLKNLSGLLNIKIVVDFYVPSLEQVKYELLEMQSDEHEFDLVEDTVQMVRELMLIEDEFLEDTPALIVDSLVSVMNLGVLDEFTENILREKLSCMKYYRENFDN